MLQIYFVYLPTERDVDIKNHPEYINVNKLKMYRNVLNLNLLRSALRKIFMQRGMCKEGKYGENGIQNALYGGRIRMSENSNYACLLKDITADRKEK